MNSSKLEITIIILYIFLITAHFISSFFPDQRLWGINHLAYFPIPFKIIFTLIPLLIFIPKLNLGMQNLFERMFSFSIKLKDEKSIRSLLFFGIGFTFLFLFWLLRTKTFFLGDGYQVISQLESGNPLLKWTEPLEVLVHLYLYRFLNFFIKIDGETLYAGVSLVLGVILVLLVISLAFELGKNSWERLFCGAVLVTMGSIQLFLGYAEHYAMAYLGIVAYLLFSIKSLKGEKRYFIPFLVFLISFFSHVSTFYLFPSLIFLYFLAPSKKNSYFLFKKIQLSFMVVLSIFLLFVIFYVKRLGFTGVRLFVPLSDNYYYAPGYTLFSKAHLLDVLNEQLLISPVGLVLLIVVLFSFGKARLLGDRIVQFLFLVSICQLGFCFFIDPGLGAPRDWDFFSATALGYTVLAVYLFINQKEAIFNFKRMCLILIFVSLFSTLPWVLLNANAQKSIQRFRTILELDPKRSKSGHLTLGVYFEKKEMIEEAEKESKKQRELFPEVNLVERAISYIEKGKLNNAVNLLKQAIQINPYYPIAYANLALAYTRMGVFAEAIKLYNKAIHLSPYKAAYHEGLGRVYYIIGSVDESIQSYEKAKKLDPHNPVIHYLLGLSYNQKGMLNKAFSSYKRSLKLDPDFAEASYNLGATYAKINEVDEAIFYYEKALAKKPDFALAHYGLGLALAQKGLNKKAIEHLQLYLDLLEDKAKKEEIKNLIEMIKNK